MKSAVGGTYWAGNSEEELVRGTADHTAVAVVALDFGSCMTLAAAAAIDQV